MCCVLLLWKRNVIYIKITVHGSLYSCCVASKVITAWKKCDAERATVEATEQKNSYMSANTKVVMGQSKILGTSLSSNWFNLILLRLSASGSHGYTVNHRQREKKKRFYQLITYGESTIIFLMRRPGDLWMNPSLRGSRKGDLLQRQPQVIYSIPKFAIYFPPLQPLEDLFKQ